MLKVHSSIRFAAIFILSCLVFKITISSIALSSIAVIGLDAEFDRDDQATIYFSTDLGRSSFIQDNSIKSEIFLKDKRSFKKIFMKNHIGRKIRLDVGNSPGSIKLFQIQFDSYFGEKFVLDHEKLYELLQPNSDIKTIELKKDYLIITSKGTDPYLLLNMDIVFKNYLLEYLVPFCFSLIIAVIATSIRYSSFPAFQDIRYKKPSIGPNYAVLDGIRGIAAIFVLCEHAGVLKGVGPLGVWLFFSLSGFLLATPFIRTPRKAISLNHFKNYTLRRVKRIIPMYYAFVTIYFMFRGHEVEALRHYMFLQGDIHLWTIPQEMLFYLILPLIMLVGHLLTQGKRVLFMIYILVLIVLSHKYLTKDVVSLYAYGDNKVFHVSIFLSGVFFSYLFHWLKNLAAYEQFERSLLCTLTSIAGTSLLVTLTLSSAGLIKYFGSANDTAAIYGFLSATIILLILVSSHTKVSRIFSIFPLKAVGIVGFSFYLLHPLVIWSVKGLANSLFQYRLNGFIMLVTAAIITYFLAALTYSYIERPFLHINSSH